MDFLTSLFARNGFLPHGACYSWTPGLLWAMVGADAVIAAAYFSIPVAIVGFVRQRGQAATNWVPWLFSTFIFACGVTHVMDIWTVWQPDYAAHAATKAVTAAVSIVTAVMLWRLLPQALQIPSVSGVAANLDSTPPTLGSTVPANNATNVLTNADLVATFDESVVAGTGSIELRRTSDAGLVESFNVISSPRLSFSATRLIMMASKSDTRAVCCRAAARLSTRSNSVRRLA